MAKEQSACHLKIYETSGNKYKPTPTIILNGDWLKEWRLDFGIAVNVACEDDGKLTITAVE